MNKLTNPCIRCKRVAEPEKCDNKDCALWRHWFTERWDQMRADFEKTMEKKNELENRSDGKAAKL